MSLKKELLAINQDQDWASQITDAVLEKLHLSEEEVDDMFNAACADYPAIAKIVDNLMKQREAILALTREEHNATVYGAAVVFLTLREIAEVQEMEAQFPDILD